MTAQIGGIFSVRYRTSEVIDTCYKPVLQEVTMDIQEERRKRHMDAMDAFSVRLSAWHAYHARRIGDGNMALGIRVAVENHEKRRRMTLHFEVERRKSQRRA
jgi:N-methylhydantoinase B/oxoprolinase/acetone carboxylase alpha subunit